MIRVSASEVPRMQSWDTAASVAARHAPRMHTEDRMKGRIRPTDAQIATAKRLKAEGYEAVYISKFVGCPNVAEIAKAIA